MEKEVQIRQTIMGLWRAGFRKQIKYKIQRMPFITPELTASPAHTIPYEILEAIDEWTWKID